MTRAIAVALILACAVTSITAAGDSPTRTRLITWGSAASTAVAFPSDIPSPILGIAATATKSYLVGADQRFVACPFGSTSPLPDDPVVSAAGGTDHVLALKPNGTVIAGGSNSHGQSTVPASLTDVVKVFAGSNASGALKNNGSVVLWGSFSSTAVPAGTYADFALNKGASTSASYVGLRTNGTVISSVWTPPAGLRNIVEVAAGGSAVQAARRGDGQLFILGNSVAVPSDLGPIISVDAGLSFIAAVRADGTIRAWGTDTQGATRVPTTLGPATRLRCGEFHTIVLLADGTVSAFGIDAGSPALAIPRSVGSQPVKAVARNGRTTVLRPDGVLVAWGSSASLPPPEDCIDFAVSWGVGWPGGSGDVFVGIRDDGSVWSRFWFLQPPELTQAVSIAAGSGFCVAVATSGTVFAWGTNSSMTTVPASVGFATRVEAGNDFALAHRVNGTLGHWGASSLAPPTTLGVVNSFSAGVNHALARRDDGLLVGWGTTIDGAAQVPSDLGPVLAFSAGDRVSLAVRADGSLRFWGCGASSCPNGLASLTPPPLPPIVSISAGYGHLVATVDDDCNGNGISDIEELGGHDCDGNGVHDACDAALGRLEDCNGNGVGDACEKLLEVERASEPFSPIGVGSPAIWTIPAVARASGNVKIDVRARGDFGTALEFVTVSCGEFVLGQALAASGECSVITPWTSFTLSANQYNNAIAKDGSLTLRADPSIAVDPEGCAAGSWLELRFEYLALTSVDCNANGVLDSCEIDAQPAADGNRNGILDLCEAPFADCPADFDRDGAVGMSDLAILLSTWGTATTLPGVDIVPDGIIDSADLSVLLQTWGPCSRP